MADAESKCLRCRENIIGISADEGDKFFVLCIANAECAEREDRNLEEKFLCGLSKRQFEILARLTEVKLTAPVEEL